MQHIETIVLDTAASSVEFTSIVQDGTDLLILWTGRTTQSAVFTNCLTRFNGSTTDHTTRVLYGTGAAADTTAGVPRFVGYASGANATANTFGNASLYIPNYAGSTNKSYSADTASENNATSAFSGIVAGVWAVTDPITSVMIESSSGNFVVGSSFSLYKITAGSDGIVTVS